MYWRCVDHSCLGRATTDENDEVIEGNHAHDHPPETAQVTVAKVVEKMKQRAKNETTINSIYCESLQEINQDPELADAAAILPTLSSLKSSFKSSLYRKRRERLPSLPAIRSEVEFGREWYSSSP